MAHLYRKNLLNKDLIEEFLSSNHTLEEDVLMVRIDNAFGSGVLAPESKVLAAQDTVNLELLARRADSTTELIYRKDNLRVKGYELLTTSFVVNGNGLSYLEGTYRVNDEFVSYTLLITSAPPDSRDGRFRVTGFSIQPRIRGPKKVIRK